MPTFMELLSWNEEFTFIYNETKYEIVYEHGLSLYLSDGKRGVLIRRFYDREDFLYNGFIDDKKICDIVSQFIVD